MLLAEGWRLAEQPQIELQAFEGACSHRAEGTLTVPQRGGARHCLARTSWMSKLSREMGDLGEFKEKQRPSRSAGPGNGPANSSAKSRRLQ